MVVSYGSVRWDLVLVVVDVVLVVLSRVRGHLLALGCLGRHFCSCFFLS